MYTLAQRNANAYTSVGIETGVIAASPHQLVAMLYEGALLAVLTASQQMKAGNISGKGQSISKAINIIDNGLRASLDKQLGGAVAENLESLYDYLSRRLLMANLKNEPEILDEVNGLLLDLKSSWDAIGSAPTPTAESATIINFKA